MSSSGPITYATWNSSPRLTWTPRRSGATLPRPSWPARTTRSRSVTCPRPGSRCSAGRPWTGWASTTSRSSPSPTSGRWTSRRRSGTRGPTCSCPTCRWARSRPTVTTRSARSTRAAKVNEAGVPTIGDDIEAQVGATITHRVLAKLFEDRGVELLRTYQLNVGGNMDFMNMLERKRLQSKKISKTQAVTSQIPHEMAKADVHIGPSDHVPWLDDRKWAYVRLEGRSFGDTPLNLEYKLEVWDSPNSAGVIIDAVRAAKIAKDRGIGGPVLSASSYFMKSPPVQYFDDEARENVEKFINGDVER